MQLDFVPNHLFMLPDYYYFGGVNSTVNVVTYANFSAGSPASESRPLGGA